MPVTMDYIYAKMGVLLSNPRKVENAKEPSTQDQTDAHVLYFAIS